MTRRRGPVAPKGAGSSCCSEHESFWKLLVRPSFERFESQKWRSADRLRWSASADAGAALSRRRRMDGSGRHSGAVAEVPSMSGGLFCDWDRDRNLATSCDVRPHGACHPMRGLAGIFCLDQRSPLHGTVGGVTRPDETVVGVGGLYPDRLRARLRCQQLPQHVLQDAAVLVVENFLRCINAHRCLELDDPALLWRVVYLAPAANFCSSIWRIPSKSKTSSPVSPSDSAL